MVASVKRESFVSRRASFDAPSSSAMPLCCRMPFRTLQLAPAASGGLYAPVGVQAERSALEKSLAKRIVLPVAGSAGAAGIVPVLGRGVPALGDGTIPPGGTTAPTVGAG